MAGGIILQWKDRNFSEIQHKIYKSDTPMTLGMLPTPIATLGSNVTEYIDYDVIEGNTYYYRIGAVRGNDEAVSDELMMVATFVEFGIGSDTFIGGDMNAGFLGEVSTTELIAGNQLASSIGLSAGSAQNSSEPWLKFALDNKILYIAKKPYRNNLSWNDINARSAVFDNENSPIITIGDYTLSVSLMTGVNNESSEWNKLFYNIHVDSPNDNNWFNYSSTDLGFFGSGRRSWMQESSSSSRIIRGDSSLFNISTFLPQSTNSNQGWRPVLRLQI